MQLNPEEKRKDGKRAFCGIWTEKFCSLQHEFSTVCIICKESVNVWQEYGLKYFSAM